MRSTKWGKDKDISQLFYAGSDLNLQNNVRCCVFLKTFSLTFLSYQFCLFNNVNNDMSQDGNTALMIGIKFNKNTSVIALMDAGVDLNIENKVTSELSKC